jgi:hypothetical protein
VAVLIASLVSSGAVPVGGVSFEFPLKLKSVSIIRPLLSLKEAGEKFRVKIQPQ